MFIGFTTPALDIFAGNRRSGLDRRAAAARQAAINGLHASIEINLDGMIAAINPKYLALIDSTAEAVVGRPFSALLAETERDGRVYRDFWDQLARGAGASALLVHNKHAGRSVTLSLLAASVAGVDGKTTGFVALANDVTETSREQAIGRRAQEALDAVSVAVMMVDRNFTVTQVNRGTLDLLSQHQEAFRKAWPGFDPAKIVGSNIDMFHRNPSHQRRMLADKSRLPFRTDISVGDLKFALNVSASHGPDGSYDGNILEWMDVTQARKNAADVAAQVDAAKALTQAVHQVQDAVRAAEHNDLTKRVPLDGKSGDIGALCTGLNGLLDTMVSIVTSITEASATISTGAREIAMGNTDLSQRTEEQASSLEQTAASLGELTSTVRQNADNAQQANKLATSASDVAVKGGAIVNQVVRTMDDITAASRKISEIIGVIDEIAFQTNILALNAAVEAARAGEQGRGFAVVAAEVRNLAQRSANAAKEIKSLIADSGSKVEAGSKLVATAGDTMEEIVVSVKRVSDIMAEISAASKEQSSGIDQVNIAVSQMDKITQQNAALVEEAAAAAKSMEEQTIELSQIVSSFQVGASAPGPYRSVSTPRPRHGTSPAASRALPARKPAKGPLPAAPACADQDDWKEF